MQFATGTVIDGKVVFEGTPLPEGAIVAILAREADETFDVPADLEAELQASLAEADRGETMTPEELFARLRRVN
jgi:predicted transcriptional regulator